ncbi:MAG: hypothetical protein Ct9H300mP11_32230 [Chloroflexota bacterium]|nr:MAG: hypothetical protein Ct9H300mP11_32230 [Chloroflexota bacterium]
MGRGFLGCPDKWRHPVGDHNVLQGITVHHLDATMSAASGIPVRFLQYLLPPIGWSHNCGITEGSGHRPGDSSVDHASRAPAALLARRLPAIMGFSVLVGLISSVAGLYLSFHADLPTGPSIVVVATGIFLAALLFSPSNGLIWQARR